MKHELIIDTILLHKKKVHFSLNWFYFSGSNIDNIKIILFNYKMIYKDQNEENMA